MSDKQLDALRLADAYAEASFEQGLERRTLDPRPEEAREALAAELRRQHAELIAKDEAIAELVEALKALIGHDHDDPLSGWRGHGGDDILFECEYCRAKHEDVTLIPHSDDCPVAKGRAAIAKHGAAL